MNAYLLALGHRYHTKKKVDSCFDPKSLVDCYR